MLRAAQRGGVELLVRRGHPDAVAAPTRRHPPARGRHSPPDGAPTSALSTPATGGRCRWSDSSVPATRLPVARSTSCATCVHRCRSPGHFPDRHRAGHPRENRLPPNPGIPLGIPPEPVICPRSAHAMSRSRHPMDSGRSLDRQPDVRIYIPAGTGGARPNQLSQRQRAFRNISNTPGRL